MPRRDRMPPEVLADLVDLLAACGVRLGDKPGFRQRVEKLWDERRWVLAGD